MINPAVSDWSVWYYAIGADKWQGDNLYRIKIWDIKDDVGNSGPQSSYEMVYDTSPPLSEVTYPGAGSTINGLAG